MARPKDETNIVNILTTYSRTTLQPGKPKTVAEWYLIRIFDAQELFFFLKDPSPKAVLWPPLRSPKKKRKKGCFKRPKSATVP